MRRCDMIDIDEFLEILGEYWKNYCPDYSFAEMIGKFEEYISFKSMNFAEMSNEDILYIIENCNLAPEDL